MECIVDIKIRITSNFLLLTSEKTEVLIIRPKTSVCNNLEHCLILDTVFNTQYLSELLLHYSPSCLLRSQNSGHLIIPRISKSTAGSRTFSYLVPKLWNNLPNTVREADTLCQFKSRLKTHLFNLAYT